MTILDGSTFQQIPGKLLKMQLDIGKGPTLVFFNQNLH